MSKVLNHPVIISACYECQFCFENGRKRGPDGTQITRSVCEKQGWKSVQGYGFIDPGCPLEDYKPEEKEATR